KARTAPVPFVVGARDVVAAAISANGSLSAALGWGDAALFDANTGRELWTRFVSPDPLICATFSRDSAFLAVADSRGRLLILSTVDGVVRGRLSFTAPAVCLTSTETSAVAGLMNGHARRVDFISGESHEWSASSAPIGCIASSPDGSKVVTGSGRGGIVYPT